MHHWLMRRHLAFDGDANVHVDVANPGSVISRTSKISRIQDGESRWFAKLVSSDLPGDGDAVHDVLGPKSRWNVTR